MKRNDQTPLYKLFLMHLHNLIFPNCQTFKRTSSEKISKLRTAEWIYLSLLMNAFYENLDKSEIRPDEFATTNSNSS